jgi:hypothetical protein
MKTKFLASLALLAVASIVPASGRSESKGSSATLSVDSEPRGAEVYVDSEYQGVTPLQNVRVPAGQVPVTLLKEGFVRHTTRITLKPGETKSLGVVKLGDAFGEIYISSYPPRASVYVNGDKVNARTPLTIKRVPRDKPHTIRLQLEGYGEWEREITLEEKDKKKYDVELEKR